MTDEIFPTEMNAIIKKEKRAGLELTTWPVPSNLGPQEVLINVKRSSICGTDLHIYKWDQWSATHMKPPLVVGHEMGGEIVAIGSDVRHLNIGDHVSVETHLTCGHCKQCLTGNGHICENVRILGVHVDGTYASYVKIPAPNAIPMPSDMPWEVLSIMEPFGNAVHTVFAEDVSGKSVLITGAGPIGLMAIAVAKAIGAGPIITTDISDYRLGFAKKMGADLILNPKETDVINEIMTYTDGEGVEAVMEMSGAEPAIHQGFEVVQPGGHVALLGLPQKNISLNLNDWIIFKSIRIYGITGRKMFETWFRARKLLQTKRVDLKPLITHTFKLSEFEKGFDLLMKGKAVKVTLVPDE